MDAQTMNTLVDRFLKRAVNYSERVFWIDKTYRYFVHNKIIPGFPVVPRALRQAPYLYTIASFWDIETRLGRLPTQEEFEAIWKNERADLRLPQPGSHDTYIRQPPDSPTSH